MLLQPTVKRQVGNMHRIATTLSTELCDLRERLDQHGGCSADEGGNSSMTKHVCEKQVWWLVLKRKTDSDLKR